MSDTKNNEPLYIKTQRFLTEIFGGSGTVSVPNKHSDLINRDLLYGASLHTKEEMLRILDPGGQVEKSDHTANDITSLVSDILTSNRSVTETNEELISLSPELKQAGKLLISSILSPDDLQNNSLSFTQDHPLLTQETNNAISELISEHMCKTRNLHKLLPKWLYNILLGSGATPIMVLPNSNNRILDDLAKQIDIVRNNNIDTPVEYRVRDSVLRDELDFKKSFFQESPSPSLRSFGGISSLPKLEDAYKADIIETFKDEKLWEDANKNIVPLLSALDDNEVVIVSDNFPAIGKGRKNVIKAEKRISDIVKQRFISKARDIYKIDDNLMLAEGDHPTMLPLDSNTVIPVGVPGSSSEHVGYFVTVDELGSPMGASDTDRRGATVPELSKTTFDVMFDGSKSLAKLSADDKVKYSKTIFNIALKQMIESKLTDIGLAGSKLETFNNVAGFIFNNFIKKNKVRLVFVPAELMVYIALDHRQDGTGKSRLEDGASLILALKNTLIVSNIMRAMSNAMPQKTISVDVPDDVINIPALFEDIYNIHSQKKTFNGVTNPIAISKGIVDQHLTIVPKNLKGLEGLENMEEAMKSTSSGDDNDNLIERFDRQSCISIGLPHHTLGKLNESDFATSITSNNLLFSASVRTDQKTVTDHLTRLAQLELTYSEPLQRNIVSIIKKDSKFVKDLAKEGKKTLKQDEESADKGIYGLSNLANDNGSMEGVPDKIITILKSIISGLYATLPAPNNVVDNARFEELQKFIDIADKLADKICSPELLAKEDREDERVLMAAKAQIVKNIVQKFIAEQGFGGVFEADIKRDFDVTDVASLALFVKNVRASVDDPARIIAEKRKAAGGDEGGGGGNNW